MHRGSNVRVHSLAARAELNGSEGTALAFDEAKGRWAVDLAVCGRMLLREANLTPLSRDGQATMAAVATCDMDADARSERASLAATRLREDWVLGKQLAAAAESRPPAESRAQVERRLKADTRVWQLDDVFDAAECAAVVRAVEAASEQRGWTKLRHKKFPTTDLELTAVPACEAFVRGRIFRRVLRALAPHYFPSSLLPEHLELRDAFYVKYSAAAGQQRALEMHSDGSIFSFNVLLCAAHARAAHASTRRSMCRGARGAPSDGRARATAVPRCDARRWQE
jgi:hypothetical protein